MISLYEQLATLKARKKSLEDQLEATSAEITSTSNAIIESWTESGTNQVKNDLGTFYLHKDFRCSTTNKDLLHAYLSDNGLGDMIKAGVPAPTLTAWAKDSKLTKDELARIGINPYEKFSVKLIGVK